MEGISEKYVTKTEDSFPQVRKFTDFMSQMVTEKKHRKSILNVPFSFRFCPKATHAPESTAVRLQPMGREGYQGSYSERYHLLGRKGNLVRHSLEIILRSGSGKDSPSSWPFLTNSTKQQSEMYCFWIGKIKRKKE